MQLTYDRVGNTLRLTLDGDRVAVACSSDVPGLLDVAANGRLVGLEVAVSDPETLRRWLHDPISCEMISLALDGTAYFQLTTGDDRDSRASEITVRAEYAATGELIALAIPRRGTGYEISYPSGNQ